MTAALAIVRSIGHADEVRATIVLCLLWLVSVMSCRGWWQVEAMVVSLMMVLHEMANLHNNNNK